MKKIIPIIKAETLIPEGIYCYSPIKAPCEENGFVYQVKVCPYWEPYNEEKHGQLPEDLIKYKDEYDGAYCRYIKNGDWLENGTSLLFDQVKECGVKDYDCDD